jgi:hypothetical protein
MTEATASDTLLAAISTRDFTRFAQVLAPTAQARFLLPRGPEIQRGREAITQRVAGWFGGASEFEVLQSGRDLVGRRSRLNWRFRLIRDGITSEIIDQVAFVDSGPEGITAIDLVCSGFLPDNDKSGVVC